MLMKCTPVSSDVFELEYGSKESLEPGVLGCGAGAEPCGALHWHVDVDADVGGVVGVGFDVVGLVGVGAVSFCCTLLILYLDTWNVDADSADEGGGVGDVCEMCHVPCNAVSCVSFGEAIVTAGLLGLGKLIVA